MPKLQKISSILFVFLCLNLVHLTNSTQDTLQTIRLAIPAGTESLFVNTILPRFYADNPNLYVTLETISADTLDGLQNSVLVSSPNDYYEQLGALMNRADVHWIYSGMLSVEASRAGYLLDLQALVSADAHIQPDDYYPAVWQAYRGYCAAKTGKFFGWQLHLVTNAQGCPVNFMLLPAAWDELILVQDLLAVLPEGSIVVADKGHISQLDELLAYLDAGIRLVPK